MLIIATFEDLDNPKLYIKKSHDDISYHIIKITDEIIKDLFYEKK